MINSAIMDGGGSRERASVQDQALVMTQLTYPPFGSQLSKPFKQYVTIDGTSTGSNDMGVDGSATPVDFYIPTNDDNDRYITQLNYILGYGGAAYLYHFADSGAALANGIRIFYTSVKGENNIESAIKTNGGMLRMCVSDFLPSDWESRNFAAINDYGYMGTIDLIKMVPPYGIKLDRGSNQKLIIRIKDNLAPSADLFNFYAIGFERFDL